jgi:uncharacterized cupin superfamily protein
VSEAPLRQTDNGRIVDGDGWYVLNARDARWRDKGPRGFTCDFEAGTDFPQLGFNLFVLGPGQPMSMYHWEADQEDFLVLSGEALLIAEGEERPLRQWDFVHFPPRVPHTIVGAGEGPAAILAVGARFESTGENWGGYPVDETAARHNASAEEETTSPAEAYGRFPDPEVTSYREGLLPDLSR